jgi:hypothetical protein
MADSLDVAVKIVVIPQDDVIEYGKERFNSNNHYDKSKGPPEDYVQNLKETCAKFWLSKFHLSYYVVNLQKRDWSWILEADKIGTHTKRFPKMFEDELEDIVHRYSFLDKIFLSEPKGFFIRTEHVSLKEGMHGAGPYRSFKEIVESLCTCICFHNPISFIDTENSEPLSLYFLPWKEIIRGAEFRVFIYQNEITAISQQHLYESNKILAKLETEEERNRLVFKWIKILLDHFRSVIRRKITHIDSYVMDIAILNPEDPDPQPYFIEINTFGKTNASGSSLFHWLLNEEILYGNGKSIEFRYTL